VTVAIEMLDVTEAYLQHVDKIALQSFGALELIGGNLLIHIDGVASRTIVASGPRKGLYREVTEQDAIHCAIVMPQWVLLHLIEPDPERPLDLDALVADGTVVMDGDVAIYERFMELPNRRRTALSVRMQ
jgi:hypothetical protein